MHARKLSVGAVVTVGLGLLLSGAGDAFTRLWGFPVAVLGLLWLLHTIEQCRRGRMQFTLAAIAAGFFAHAHVAVVSAPLFTLPVGAEIRPMAWALIVWGLSMLSLVLGVPLAAAGCFMNRRYFLNGFAILLCVTVGWSGNALLDAAVRLRGLVLKS